MHPKRANTPLFVYCDADFAGDTKTRRSTTGFVVTMGDVPVCWMSRRQSLVATSTLEAEYIALFEASQEIVFVQRLVTDAGNQPVELPTTILCDNQGAKEVAEHPKFHKRTKHIDIKFHKIRERVQTGIVAVEYVASANNTADIFTKALPRETFQRHMRSLVSPVPPRFLAAKVESDVTSTDKETLTCEGEANKDALKSE